MKTEEETGGRRLGVGHSIPDLSAFSENNAFTYLLRCVDGSLYCGWSSNIINRLKAHNLGKGAKYTRGRLPAELVYFEVYEDKAFAMRRECEIKRMDKNDKEKLINEAGSFF